MERTMRLGRRALLISIVTIAGVLAGCDALDAAEITKDSTCKDYLEQPSEVRYQAALRVSREVPGVSSPGNPNWVLTLDAACGSTPDRTLEDYFARR